VLALNWAIRQYRARVLARVKRRTFDGTRSKTSAGSRAPARTWRGTSPRSNGARGKRQPRPRRTSSGSRTSTRPHPRGSRTSRARSSAARSAVGPRPPRGGTSAQSPPSPVRARPARNPWRSRRSVARASTCGSPSTTRSRTS
jgi:hypothetical protein